MGSVPWAGWEVCAALGGTWVVSNFKNDTVIIFFFVFPPPFCPPPTERGLLAW